MNSFHIVIIIDMLPLYITNNSLFLFLFFMLPPYYMNKSLFIFIYFSFYLCIMNKSLYCCLFVCLFWGGRGGLAGCSFSVPLRCMEECCGSDALDLF